MRRSLSVATAAISAMSFALPAFAAHTSYTLFGDATELGGGVIQLRSDIAEDPAFGGIDFDVADDLTFAELETLSTEFNVTDDDCAGGSPRFQINLDTDDDGDVDGNIFSYLGPQPNYTECPENTWVDSGDLLDDSRFLDTSQLTGGTFYDTYAAALTKYGDATVLGVQLVADAGWAFADGEQTILVRDITVNGPTSVDQCKKGGWQDLGFRNQGQCVSSIASKNK